MTAQIEITGPLNKASLGRAVAAELGVPEKDGHAAVRAVMEVIARAVTSGHNVNVPNFGTWISSQRNARTARDLFSGRPVQVPEHQAVHFRVAPRLREIVRGADPRAATISRKRRT